MKFDDLHTYSTTDNGVYLVREEWPDQSFDSETYYDYIFVPAMKMFQKDTWQESKKEADLYYSRRLKEIRVRRLMFPALDKQHFTLILSYAESEVDIGHREFKIVERHESNLPYDEDFKDGLFRKLPREKLE